MKKLLLAAALTGVLCSTSAVAASLPAGWEVVSQEETMMVFANKAAKQGVMVAHVADDSGAAVADVAKGAAAQLKCNTDVAETELGIGFECPASNTLVYVTTSNGGYDILTLQCDGENCDEAIKMAGAIVGNAK